MNYMNYVQRRVTPEDTEIAQRPGYNVSITQITTPSSLIHIDEILPTKTTLRVPVYTLTVEGHPNFKIPAFEVADFLPRVKILLQAGHQIHPDSMELYNRISGYSITASPKPIAEKPPKKSKRVQNPLKTELSATDTKKPTPIEDNIFKFMLDGEVVLTAKTKKAFRKALRKEGLSIRDLQEVSTNTYHII